MLGTFPEKGLLGFKNKLVGNDNRGVFPIGCDLIYALVKPSGDIGTRRSCKHFCHFCSFPPRIE